MRFFCGAILVGSWHCTCFLCFLRGRLLGTERNGLKGLWWDTPTVTRASGSHYSGGDRPRYAIGETSIYQYTHSLFVLHQYILIIKISKYIDRLIFTQLDYAAVACGRS